MTISNDLRSISDRVEMSHNDRDVMRHTAKRIEELEAELESRHQSKWYSIVHRLANLLGCSKLTDVLEAVEKLKAERDSLAAEVERLRKTNESSGLRGEP